MKGKLICFHKETNYPIKLRSLNVHSLFYAPVGVRGVLGDGYPSEVTLYILRSNCNKFGAFVRSVPVLLLSDLTICAHVKCIVYYDYPRLTIVMYSTRKIFVVAKNLFVD